MTESGDSRRSATISRAVDCFAAVAVVWTKAKEEEMSATAQIRPGNVSDAPADLIVLPCSTQGTMNGPVAGRSPSFAIPVPRDHMELGEVDVRPIECGRDAPKVVAFAASVDHSARDRRGRPSG